MASTIQFPSLYGVACRKSNFRLGTRWDRDYTVLYVTKGSIADQNGIREGDKILTLNGKLLIDDALVADREFGGKRSGDTVVVEVLREGKKKSISIPLKYTDTARMPVDNNLGSPYGTR